MKSKMAIVQLYLRIAMGGGFFYFGLDRLGAWGPNGRPWVSWGDWAHFSEYAHKVMSFLPSSLAEILAIGATVGEISFGLMLVIGFFTRIAAIGSGLLALSFALSMAISFGITSPMGYSVFTTSAAAFLLSGVAEYRWSIDALRSSKTR